MINTEYGSFDGDSWQQICKICFIRKFHDFIEIPASPGDYGLEGFTKSGYAFQCYCPDNDYSADELYNKQRDKITVDLGKLKTYKKQLKSKLGDTKIKIWYFVTPQYRKNDIIDHCEKKSKEVLSWSLDIIDNANFIIIPTDIDFLHPFLEETIRGRNEKLSLNITQANSVAIDDYKNGKGGILIKNALFKHTKRLSHKDVNLEEEIPKLVHKTIRHFLDGESIITKWRNLYSTDYELFARIITKTEESIEDICLARNEDPNVTYLHIKDIVCNKIKEEFKNYSTITIDELTDYVIADWLLRCPLQFIDTLGKQY